MSSDAVHIGGPANLPQPNMSANFRNTYNESKAQNTGLSPFAADNIRGTHFKIGHAGGF